MMRHLLKFVTNKNVVLHLGNKICRQGHLCSTIVLDSNAFCHMFNLYLKLKAHLDILNGQCIVKKE